MRDDRARALREALSDPIRVAEALGLERSKTERLKWRCPAHGGSSLSLRKGRDSTLQVKCFGCDLSGDVFRLIAAARGLDVRGEFPEVLAEAGELAGMREHRPLASPPREASTRPPERTYPPRHEIEMMWSQAIPVEADPDAARMLEARGLDPGRVDGTGCARVIPRGAVLPAWARYRGRSWLETGHRLVLPMVSSEGVMRSVRAWRVVEGDSPKRLPPSGHRASSLMLADDVGIGMLRGTFAPPRVLVVEGEPDFLTWASRQSFGGPLAILGIMSGSWSEAFAARVPSGARVIVRTHQDAAGEKYADEINESLRARCTVLRPRDDDEGRQRSRA